LISRISDEALNDETVATDRDQSDRHQERCSACGSRTAEHKCPHDEASVDRRSKRRKVLAKLEAVHSEVDEIIAGVRRAMGVRKNVIVQVTAGQKTRFSFKGGQIRSWWEANQSHVVPVTDELGPASSILNVEDDAPS
jgi:hypothetical protein